MAIDANILLQGRVPDAVGAIGQGYQLGQAVRQAPIRNRLLETQAQGADLQLSREKQAAEVEKYKFQLQDLASDWGTVKPLLASGDMQNANVALAQRIQKIKQRGGDPSHTIELRDRINSGQITPQQAIAEVDGALEGARAAGLLGSGQQAPSSRTYEPVPMYDDAGKFTGMGIPTFDPRTGQAKYTPIQGGQTVDPATLAGMKAGSSQNAQNRSDLQYKPQITGAETGEKLRVEGELRPGIEADITKARAEAEDLVAQTISKRSSANSLESAQLLKSNLSGNLDKIYGRGESLYPDLLRSQKGIDLIADRNQLVGMLTLAGRGQLKGQGPLTDQEQKTVQQAISVMSNPDISPARAEIALNDAFKVLETAAGRPAQPRQPAQGGKQGGEFTSSTGIQFTVE